MVYKPAMRRSYAAYGGVPSHEAYVQKKRQYEDADQKTYDDFRNNEFADKCSDSIRDVSGDKYSDDDCGDFVQ